MTPTDQHWMALLLCTESNRPIEWPFLARVAMNRVIGPMFPDTIEGVVLQRMQFSAFNAYTKSKVRPHESIFRAVFEDHVKDPVLFAHAVEYATSSRFDEAPEITPDTCHYWSPRSMVPPGAQPPWAPSARRLYTPSGIDPDRFVFAEGVR